MLNPSFISSSLKTLVEITTLSHNDDTREEALSIWRKHLNIENPLWKYVDAEAFTVGDSGGTKAHVIALVDSRMPNLGIVGFFACTDPSVGAHVLDEATQWLRKKPGIKDVYGPINGTITCDYRFNLEEDFLIPGEPVNPMFYIDAFEQSGFKVFNKYVSGISRHYKTLMKLLLAFKPIPKETTVRLRPFSSTDQMKDLKTYHKLMNEIFPANSIYCPAISWEERVYNIADHKPFFNSDYSFFLEDGDRTIGFIVAYPYEDHLVIKTVGILAEYRNQNLSSILIKQVHDQAANDNLKSAIYSTIRTDTAVYKMRQPGVKVYRRYVTMRKSLGQ